MKPSRFVLLLCLIMGCARQATPSVSESVLTPTATTLPTPTSTATTLPTPTSTATSLAVTVMPANSGMVLNTETLSKLFQASMAYVADTEEQAIQVARSLKFIDNDGDPSNMCGPLAVAILRDAGLINKYTDLHAFWLWRPDQNPRLAEVTFPADQFAPYHFTESIGTFNFKDFPLKTGDFLYIYAGPQGSFEHMLVVDRVDEAGRAYSVTNVNSDKGFVIQEVMLYDPRNPGVGQFYTWTDLTKWKMGLTGFGGFDLWRVTSPPPQATPQEATLADGIDQVIEESGGDWHIFIKQVGGNVIYSRGSDDRIPIASVVKVPIAMLFFKSLEESGIPPDQYADYLATYGIGRSYKQLLEAMLVDSEEEATNTLLENTRTRGLNIADTLMDWGINDMDIGNRYSTARQVGIAFEGLYAGNLISPVGRAYILNLMSTYTPNDDTRLGVIQPLLPVGSEFYNKRGMITKQFLTVDDSAIIVVPGDHGQKAYVVVVFSFQGKSKTNGTNDIKLVQAIEQIARLFGGYITSSP
jgi:beta-lactamase class A